jgi:hypothetical protein
MKQLIAISTATFLALVATAQAKEKPNKQAAPKAKAPQLQKQPAAPRSKPAQVQKQQQFNVGPDIHNNVRKQKELRKPPTVESKKVKPDKAPKLEKTDKAPDPTNVVAEDKLRKVAKPTAKIKKLDPAVVQKIRSQHANFKATPKTAITSAQFNPNYRIEAAQNWSGPQYEVFRTYQPRWQDRSWWSSRYTTISLIGGGWYYWDAGYWYPAWGYDEAYDYYPYDGPIYVGSNPRPFDQVVADVQAVLQEQGFYRGEIDGLVGPLTREALAEYQSAAGLYTTQTIDQPTLESLGLGYGTASPPLL